MKKSRKHVLNQLFDVKPMTYSGDLHWGKIDGVKKCLNLKEINSKSHKKSANSLNLSKLPDGRPVREVFAPILTNYWQPRLKDNVEDINKLALEHMTGIGYLTDQENPDRKKILSELESMMGNSHPLSIKKDNGFWGAMMKDNLRKNSGRSSLDLSEGGRKNKTKFKVFNYFVLTAFLFFTIIGVSFFRINASSKNTAISYAVLAGEKMQRAQDDFKKMDFKSAKEKFLEAQNNFIKSKQAIGSTNYFLLSAASGLPLISSSRISGINLVDAGQYLAKAGELVSGDLAEISSLDLKDIFKQDGKSELIAALKLFDKDLDQALTYVILAEKNIKKADPMSLPDNLKEVNLLGRAARTKAEIIDAQKYVKLALNLLGAYRIQDYLLLFQNPSEMRASGGFIGSYGIIELAEGRIKKILIDDIFNPDGQLREKIIPPFPIQKISTAWSMHDANWFFDFPTSAKKVAWFYEKTGGPTVSAVFALNPFVIEKLLEIAGPVDMPEYGFIITAENFVDVVQYKVEKDFDKEENKPKKILADFMPKFLEKLFHKKEDFGLIVQILIDSAKEKDLMAYFSDEDVQKMISDNKLSGEIVDSKNDYLAVVSSNINGYKTDRVVEGSVDLKSEIGDDGSVVNTLTIIKHHTGGDLKYDYYNKVNADYLRVYVPRGAMLIDAKGGTVENNKPPVDYKKLEFKEDEDVAKMESSLIIDEKTKTQIYQESGKTVFANWVFVSPKEDVEIIYKYKLPQKVYFKEGYQMVFQKQSGSNMKLNWRVDFPDDYKIISDNRDFFVIGSSADLKTDFNEDKIINFKFNNF